MFEYMDGIVDAVEEIGQATVDVPRKDYKRRNHSGKMDKENIRNHYKRAAKAGVFF